MADPSVRLSGSTRSGTSISTPIAVAITGTPADGETILFVVAWNESPAFATPAVPGFSPIASIVTADFNPLYILGKIASSEGANPTYTCTFTGANRDGAGAAAVLIYQNSTGVLPTNKASTHDTSASTTYSIPALTTATAGGDDLVAVTNDGNDQSDQPNYGTWGSSLVELFDLDGNVSPFNYNTLGIAHATRAVAGVQAATTVVCDINDKNVALRIEVPAVVAGGGVTVRPLTALGVGN